MVDFPQRTWPDKEIEKAPVWCSVDLRDGNQSLIEPMVVEEKIEMFNLKDELGIDFANTPWGEELLKEIRR